MGSGCVRFLPMNTKVRVHKQATLPPGELVDGVELERAALFNERARRARVRDERPPEHDAVEARGRQRAHVGDGPPEVAGRELARELARDARFSAAASSSASSFLVLRQQLGHSAGVPCRPFDK